MFFKYYFYLLLIFSSLVTLKAQLAIHHLVYRHCLSPARLIRQCAG